MVCQVASVTAVRNLVDRDRITEANGRLHATYAAAAVLGPLLAGVVSARFGPPPRSPSTRRASRSPRSACG